jgi:hypothetical protein
VGCTQWICSLRARHPPRLPAVTTVSLVVVGTTPPATIMPPLAGARKTPPAALLPPLAGARATPPAVILPQYAGARATSPAASMPPLAGARATPPAVILPQYAGARATSPAALLPPLAGALTTSPAATTALFREDSISGSASGALASVGRRRIYTRTSARTRTLLPLWMWTCGCIAGTAHRQAGFASTRHRRTAAGQTTLRCRRRRRFRQTPHTPCRRT